MEVRWCGVRFDLDLREAAALWSAKDA